MRSRSDEPSGLYHLSKIVQTVFEDFLTTRKWFVAIGRTDAVVRPSKQFSSGNLGIIGP